MEGDDLRPWRLSRRDREETEAGPSMALEESVVGNPRLGCGEQKHSIFLSHSGAQKAFVRRLRNALERNAYFPFFDEDLDCLRKGEPFVQHIKDAARLADVGVVVLSDEFFNSKWPMIELAIFTEEQRRRRSALGCRELNIFPLFMGLSVEDFRNQDRRLGWFNKWHELGVTDSRIDASKWEEALGVLGGINGIKSSDFQNEDEFIKSIVSAIFKLVPPDLKWEDTHVKGKLKLHQAAIEMFGKTPPHTRFHKVRAIGLYGTGGIGKTTICKSLCNYYFAEFNGKVWHAELGKKGAEEIQKDVLHHLVGTSETLLNQTVKCKDQWRSLLWRKMEYKVFLAIDNVWDEDISREQAECLLGMGFHPDSLVIITSRNRELLQWLGIHKECCFEMPEFGKGDATAVLLQSAAPGCDIQSMTDDQRVAVAQVVERCFLAKGPISDTGSEKHYVPLALEALGRQLRLPLGGSSKKLTQWVDKLDLKWSNQRQHPIFSVLRLSYDNLPSSKHKSIFLDVALCAPRKQDNTSASVNEVCKWLSMVYCVGGDEILKSLEVLQRDGLIERWEYLTSPFGMHELYTEFAKAEAAKEENSNNQIYLYHEDGFDVPAIMQMFPHHNYWPLRRVHSYNGGFSKLSSEELRYMVHVEVLKLDFCFELESLDLRCLKSLRSLEIKGCFDLQSVEGLEDLKYLKFFRWNTCRIPRVALDLSQTVEIVEIYGSKESEGTAIDSFEECNGLLELTLSRHPLSEAVPDLQKLHKLEKVDFSGCCKIKEVRGLEGLCRLKHLNLQNCRRLQHCYGFEKLVKMETLNLEGCESMQSPEVWDLTQLVNLRCINIGGALVVRELVFNSPYLAQVGVIGCKNLATVVLRTDSWTCLNRLNEDSDGTAQKWTVDCQSVIDHNLFDTYTTLNLSNCHTLESLDDFGSLRSLQCLYLRNCWVLRTLSDLSSSPFLEVVDLSCCFSLEVLGDLGPLRSLQYLYLRDCVSLTSVGDLCTPGLKVLDLSGCSKLNSLGDFYLLRSLQRLDLSDCVSLISMPNLSHCSLLEVLDVKGCDSLMYFLYDVRNLSPLLEVLDVKGGGNLMNLLHDTVDVWDLSKLKSLRSMDISCNRVVRELVLGSPQLEELKIRGCANLRTVVLSAGCESWKLMHLLNEKWAEGALQSRIDCRSVADEGRTKRAPEYTFYCQDNMYRDSFDTYTTLNLSNCPMLESLDDIGSLRSLQCLYLQNCWMLGTLPDLSDSPFLEVVDLSCCGNLKDLGGLGLVRSMLKYLYLRDCRSLMTLGDLCTPDLKVLDLSGCYELECLGDFYSLRSLQRLDLSDCVSLISMPNLSRCSLLEVLDVKGGGNLMNLLHDTVDVWDLSKLKSLRSMDISGNRVVRELMLGTVQLTNLDVRGCTNLARVVLPTDPESWRCLNVLNYEERPEGRGKSQNWTVDCQSIIVRDSCEAYKILNFSNCHTLESLGDIGCLRSLHHLYLQNCRMLRILPDLSNHAPLLEVVDMSWCSMLKDLGGLGQLRALRCLYLRDCGSLVSLPDLASPGLTVLVVSGCSKLESLGDFHSLRSLYWLDLSGCKSLMTLPNLSYCPLLPLLNVKWCTNLMALTSTSSVSDVFKCELLTRYLVEDVLGTLELDGTAGEDSAVFDFVRRLRLSCESRRASAISDSTCAENIREGWEDWVKCGNILAEPHGKAGLLELLCVSGSKVDILYQQEVYFDGRAFRRLRHYHFPALIILAMSTECFISCIHVGNV